MKDLQRLFNAAELVGAILFFDEADARFGKRIGVKDGPDRYTSIDMDRLVARGSLLDVEFLVAPAHIRSEILS